MHVFGNIVFDRFFFEFIVTSAFERDNFFLKKN